MDGQRLNRAPKTSLNLTAQYEMHLGDAGALRARDPAIGVEGVICFEDPDGHIVELIEYFPGQLGSKSENLPKRS